VNAELNRKRTVSGICLLLALAVILVFGRTLWCGFVNFDDGPYVYENPHITRGVTLAGIGWVLTHNHAGFWHPVTSMSHMLDCQLYGLNPWGHHLTNVLLHAANAVLLLLLLRRMTGSLWASAFVAAVFALHPLRVESVAWVAERKDELSGLFGLLTMMMYARYAQQSKVRGPRTKLFYGLALGFFLLGLMSKPMLVTLPFVLLLLDYWPLGRFALLSAGDGSRFLTARTVPLVVETLPFLALAAGSGVVAFLTQSSHGSLMALDRMPIGPRLANGLVSYVVYIAKMFWPDNLAAFYPRPAKIPAWEVAGAGALLLIATALALTLARRLPYLVVGWLWYLGMLVPVIGVVQTGEQARADRFTYLPQIGLCLALAWGLKDLSASWSRRRPLLGVAAIAVLSALSVVSFQQISCWRDSESLWTHALACTRENYVADNNLGIVLAGQGRSAEATENYRQAFEIAPSFAEPHYNLGIVLAGQGLFAEAIGQYQKAIELKPGYAVAHYNLAILLARQGRAAEAIEHYGRAVEIEPDFAEAHYNLAASLAASGRNLEAISHYLQVMAINPDFPGVQFNLAVVLAAQGMDADAIEHFRRAIEINPGFAEAYTCLGNVLADQGEYAEAVKDYQRALEIKPDSAETHFNLGNLLASRGRYPEAIEHFRRALQIRPNDANARNSLNAALALQAQSDRQNQK
jgi:tetratricopeptide (TPR) repeat protein